MKPEKDPAQSGEPAPVGQPAPRRRFRIRKLEERVAPKQSKASHKGCSYGTIVGSEYY